MRKALVALLLLTPVVAGCGSDGEPAAAPSTTTTTAAARRLEPVGELPALRPDTARPVPDELAHGQSGWGVYLAVARTPAGEGTVDTTDWDAAIAELRERGFPVEGGGGEIGCDGDEAVRALADLEVDFGTAVYFLDRADARAYADSLDPAPRVVPVTYYCAD